MILRLIYESFRFAMNALRVNPLRTTLSLAGVTVGIFVIIGVFTFVDSLERSLRDSFSFLGAGMVYVQKWPFVGSPDFPWWKYFRRPMATYEEYQLLEENLQHQKGICIFATRGGTTVRRDNNSANNLTIMGSTYGYKDVFEFNLASGRYFTNQEVHSAANIAIIGVKVKQQLFPGKAAEGEAIKFGGQKYTVIGVFEEEGESLLKISSSDELVLIPYMAFKKIYYTGRTHGIESIIAVKGHDDDPEVARLQSELEGLMRKARGLKPSEENNFEMNRPEAIAKEIGKVFNVLTVVGWVIGLFAILIGAFGIANIMFVSVKERTGIIGIQKSLGAKNYFILFQFLFEAIFLSLLGGLSGLVLVYFLTFVPFGSLQLALTVGNVALAIVIVTLVGVLSGIVPALSAAKLDPVTAIRTN